MIRFCRSPFTNHSHLSLTHNSSCILKATSLLASTAPQPQSMEQVDDQPPPTKDQVQHHHQIINNNHFHSMKPLTTCTTDITSYFPQHEQLNFALLYSGLFFNPNTINNHQQSYPDAADGGTGTTASTYLTVAPGQLKSCSDGSEANAVFNYTSNTSSSRWPREETMSLLQIRSGLHSSFKEATHKGPLWDEVSRIMYEEHGYQRSGKKCREKFENLYKYYKKTKEAKSGKHDGKNYRFFKQLEALYGDQIAAQPTTEISSQTQFPPNLNDQVMMMTSSSHLVGNSKGVSPNNQLHNMKLPCDQSCLSLSYHNSSSHFTSSSSEDNNKRAQNKKNKLKMKVKEFIGIQMKCLYEQQQLCMEKVLETIELKEKEIVIREEKWRQQAEDRLEKDLKLWANERAWMKERDATLIQTLQQFTSGRSLASSHILQQLHAFSSSYTQPMSLMNKKSTDQTSSSVRDLLTLYNKESQDIWLHASNHTHNQYHDGVSGFRVMSDDNNVGNGGSMLWDGSSFGLKLNNGDENHQN